MIKQLKKLSLVLVVFLASFSVFATTYTSQYPPAQNDTYVKATTTETSPAGFKAYYATDPAKSLTGSYTSNEWYSSYPSNNINQRFHVDLGSAKIVKRIYYENSHNSGSETIAGTKNFTFWGSNSATAFATLTYATDTDWTQLTVDDSQFDQHVALNQADPKYVLVTNSTAYRYYAIKIADNWGNANNMGFRRIELQTEDAPASTFIPKIIFF